MKKLMLVVLVLISFKGYSQSFGQKILSKLEFGLKAGGNYSDFTDASFATDPLAGFHAGATVAYKFTDNFMVQEEFLFSLQGAKVLNGPLAPQDVKLFYVNVPILLKYRTNFGLYLEAGSQVGIKVKEEVAGFENADFAKKIDMGAVGGLGYQTKMGLGFGARYIYGLQKVPESTFAGVNEFKNNSIQASIFYVF